MTPAISGAIAAVVAPMVYPGVDYMDVPYLGPTSISVGYGAITAVSALGSQLIGNYVPPIAQNTSYANIAKNAVGPTITGALGWGLAKYGNPQVGYESALITGGSHAAARYVSQMIL